MKNHPESLMMGYGYNHHENQNSIKQPIYQTSTFVFNSAEEGKAFFEVAYGLREKKENEKMGMIYSRLDNPNLNTLEKRLSLWDKADDSAVFASGMAAISNLMLEFLKPGDTLLYGAPSYGGTHHFIYHVLPTYGINVVEFDPHHTESELIDIIEVSGKANTIGLIYIETPANPTNDLFDIEMCSKVAKKYSTPERKVILTVDNTFLGPVWQKPLELGADLAVYSATKYFGGHSDLLAGVVMGPSDLMIRVKTLRTFLGNMMSPNTAWLMTRSLETLQIRMERQSQSAEKIYEYLLTHPMVEKIHYLGTLSEKDGRQYEIFKKQCLGNGSMISFNIKGGEKEAFKFMNNLKLMKLAVSLGSTESLVEHPATMTHVDMPLEDRNKLGITSNLIRFSIGVEHPDDLINDIKSAFDSL